MPRSRPSLAPTRPNSRHHGQESSPRNHYSVSTVVLGYILPVAAQCGLSEGELCDRVGIEPKELEDPDARIPFDKYESIFLEAAHYAGDELFWLRKSDPHQLARNNVCWYYCLNAPKLGAIVTRSARVYRLLNNAIHPDLVINGGETIVRAVPDPRIPQFSEMMIDYGLVTWLEILRLAGGPTLVLSRVRFSSDSLERVRVAEELFEVPVEGRQVHDELVFAPGTELIANNFGQQDPNLDLLFGRLMRPTLAALDEASGTFEAQLFKLVQRQLVTEPPTLATVAASLNISRRTLQRRLTENGLSFSELLRRCRNNLAASYLANPQLNITDIALLVGYKTVASFSAAFQKWHGVSPSEFRKRIRP